MVYTEGAKVLDVAEIKELLEEETHNPTVDRLMFIECKTVKGEYKILPCYFAAWWEEEPKPPRVKSPIIFMAYITQAMSGQFGLVQVNISEDEIGTSKRIWDKPPTKALREETPWAILEAEVQ